MEITEVRIKLMEDNNERLQAFCSVTFDDAFVVRDLKIIEGTKGSFVAMPSRKLTDRCRVRLQEPSAGPLLQPVRPQARRGPRHPRRRRPGQAACRHRPPDQLRLPRGHSVRRAPRVPGREERAKQPGYICTYDDYDEGDYDENFVADPSRANANDNCRTHPAHGPPRTHSTRTGQESTVGFGEQNRKEGFGSGII